MKLMRIRSILFKLRFVLAAYACLLVIALISVEYYPYASALIWHHRNGNYTDVAGHKVRLPALWWKQDNPGYNASYLVRAWPTMGSPQPYIAIGPTYPGEMKQTDQEQLDYFQRMISYGNIYLLRKSYLVTLKSRAFVLYCEKLDPTPRDVEIHRNLWCRAARVPYVFNYSGPPEHEQEAEAILASSE